MKKQVISATLLCLAACGSAYAADSIPSAISDAVGHYIRPPKDQARDAARKPAELMAFAGIRSGMKVVDLVPEDGYYTRILSKIVGAKGAVYSYVPIPGFPAVRFDLQKAGKTVPIDPILAIQNTKTEFANVTAVWEQLYFNGGSFGLPEQVDAVLVANNYHNLKVPGFAKPATAGANNAPQPPLDLVGMNKAIFRAMKPGGVYVIVDNAADAASVKQDVTAAGFVEDGSSDILSSGSQFVLRFKKPSNASAATKRPKDDSGMASYYGNTRHSGINRDVQRWVQYHADRTFQEYGNTPAYVQIGTWFWDADGMNCMLKEYPDVERGSVICHDYSNAVNKPVDTVLDEGPNAWKIEKGAHYPDAPKDDRVQ